MNGTNLTGKIGYVNKELEVLKDLSNQEIIVKKGIGVYMDGSVQTMLHKTTVGIEFKGAIETIEQSLVNQQEQEKEFKELRENVKRWYDTLKSKNEYASEIVIADIEDYWAIKAGA